MIKLINLNWLWIIEIAMGAEVLEESEFDPIWLHCRNREKRGALAKSLGISFLFASHENLDSIKGLITDVVLHATSILGGNLIVDSNIF